MITPNEDNVMPLGTTNWRNTQQLFGIKQKDRNGHIYILGKTGTGKSTLIANMVISDMQQGNGLALIDPHGDLAEIVLSYVPKDRLANLTYFNPGNLESPPLGFNLLERVRPEHDHLVVSGIISAFRKIWTEYWGPRMEHILRHALFTLLEAGDRTLIDVEPLLTDHLFRQTIVMRISHPEVKKFWENEFERYSKSYRQEMVAPILNRLSQFLTNQPLRNVVVQQKCGFDIERIMNEKKIFVANLSKGLIGEDGSALLGSLLVTKFHLAALRRTALPGSARKEFNLYVDEVHSFITLSFADILSEARKYGLNLIVAHQHGSQLDRRIQSAMLGNVGTIIAFRLGPEDAELLAPIFRPEFGEADLMNLANHGICLRMMIDGVTSRPFSATTLQLKD